MNYSIHAILCDCEYSSEYIVISEKCTHCIKRESIPWYIELKTINKYIKLIENTSELEKRIILHRNLFEYLLTCPDFMAKNAKFRKVVISKMNEYKLDNACECLSDTFDKLTVFIDSLVTIEGYIE